MEEITIISNYYPPEKGAAANRIEQLAKKLHQKNYKVIVICPLGNYPKGELFPEYKGKFSVTENRNNIIVKRLWIYPSISKNIFVRILSVLSFSLNLFFYLLFKKTSKKVVIQSPPLLLSFISVFILSLKNKKIILNVSDLWPLAAIELNALKENSFSHKFSLFLERFIYKKASVILGQSNEIITHIQTIIPDKKCFLYRNFPEHKVDNLELISEENKPIKIFYAGLLGIAQGVLELCQKIELDILNIELHVFGDGAEKLSLGAGAHAGRPVGHGGGGAVECPAELGLDLRQSRRARVGRGGLGHCDCDGADRVAGADCALRRPFARIGEIQPLPTFLAARLAGVSGSVPAGVADGADRAG